MNTNTPKGSRNYYGEYSLEQWIKLILTKEIVLPPYQRAFVWTKEDVQELINSLQEGLFVPPITIGNYGGTTNYILDGQQRLSALLIAYLELFPKKEEFQFSSQEYQTTANDNDDPANDNEDIMPLEWKFEYFTQAGQDKESILQNIDRSKYNPIDLRLDSNFWKNSYIGFSLIIPISDATAEQQKLYSTVFRNINIKGKSLSLIESRKSLYFLREDFDQWFSPEFAYMVTIKSAPIDFVRYLSLLSQYKKDGSTERLAQTYKTKMEQYYESYILTEINNEDSSMFSRLLGSDNRSRYEALRKCLRTDSFPRQEFSSIIDADIYLFGLIYYTIAEGRTISITESLLDDIESKIEEFKRETDHSKSPSSFRYLRQRVQASINIYSDHLTDLINSSNEA